jgi:hypothetical protein
MGKGVGEIAARCRHLKIPCIGLAGAACASAKAGRTFAQLRGLTELTTTRQAKARPAFWLERLAEITAREWSQAVG